MNDSVYGRAALEIADRDMQKELIAKLVAREIGIDEFFDEQKIIDKIFQNGLKEILDETSQGKIPEWKKEADRINKI